MAEILQIVVTVPETIWKPIDLLELYDLMNSGDAAMDHPTRRFWNAIRVEPQKWKLHPWGDKGGGFWVVGVMGQHALWFNDIEDGFNISRYHAPGELSEYFCNQDQLNHAIQHLQMYIVEGYIDGRCGPPQPGAYVNR